MVSNSDTALIIKSLNQSRSANHQELLGECSMIDFNNAVFSDMKIVDNDTFSDWVESFLIDGECIINTFQGYRDGIIFTNKRIITVNVQQIRGKRKDFTSLPYCKIQAFSIQTRGEMDNITMLDLWYAGVGKVSLIFRGDVNIEYLCQIVSEGVL